MSHRSQEMEDKMNLMVKVLKDNMNRAELQVFFNKARVELAMDVPDEVFIEAFTQRITEGWDMVNTHEYKTHRNWIRSFSLVFWTELYDGEEDYTKWEKEFMQIWGSLLVLEYPDFVVHRKTRLLMNSIN